MPDGDKVHKGLSWRYQRAYKQVCDGQFGGSELADEIMSAVYKDVQQAGNQVIQFLQQISERCQYVQDMRMYSINWQEEFLQADLLAQPIYTDRRFKNLAVDACKEQLRDLRNGGNPSNCYLDLMHKYLWNIYVAQFVEKVPLTRSHYQGVSREFVGERLALMRPHVQEKLYLYAEKICRQDTVAQLPRKRSITKRSYNIDTDLGTVGA